MQKGKRMCAEEEESKEEDGRDEDSNSWANRALAWSSQKSHTKLGMCVAERHSLKPPQ